MPTALRHLVRTFLAVTAIALAVPAASPGASPGDPYPGFTTFAQHLGPATGHESATDVVVQPDGRIVTSVLNDAEVDERIVRLLPSGAVDPSFGVDGSWHVAGAGQSHVRAIALQPDGKIVYATTDATLPGIVIGRLTPSGEPDITFSSDGKFVVSATAGSNPLVEDVFVEPSGRITFIGVIKNGLKVDDLFMGRLSPFGVDDPEFAGNPMILFGSPYDGVEDGFGGITRMPNGDYIVGNPHAATSPMVWRINATGGTRVAANMPFPSTYDKPVDVIATDATHAVVLLEGTSTSGLAYLDVVATPKISEYAGNAGTIQPFPASFRGHELLRQPEGKLFVSGTDSTTAIHRAIMRLNANGTPDPTWGPGAIRHLEGTSTKRFYLDRHSLAFGADGSLVSAFHAFAGDVRQTRVEHVIARIARVRPEVVTPLAKGVVGTPVDYTLRAANDGPDASGAGTFTFSVGDGLRITSWTGTDCTVDARGGTCTFASLAAGANKTVALKVKAVSAGSHAVSATVDATTYDDDAADDTASAVHPFDAAPVAAPTAAVGTAATKPKPTASGGIVPQVLKLTLQRITGYDGRVIRGCGTVRVMCVVSRDRPGARVAPAYLRASATIPGKRTLLLVMQVKQGSRWVVKYRYRLPIGDNGGLDIKLPTDWRAKSSTWRVRTETVVRRGVTPKVSGWLLFRVR